MQRVAIARAMAMQPKLLLADEPTGNLDTATSLEILKLFQEFHALGVTLVMVTHDPEIARLAQRVVVLKDGALCDQDTVNPVPAGDLFPLAKAVS
jgi:putative ABC transport system ATP-binding protein